MQLKPLDYLVAGLAYPIPLRANVCLAPIQDVLQVKLTIVPVGVQMKSMYEVFAFQAKQFGVDDAMERFRAPLGADVVDLFRDQFVADLQQVTNGGPAILAAGMVPWYSGPTEPSKFWDALETEFRTREMWPDDRVDLLDRSSSKVVAHTPRPDTKRFQSKGLVVGYVQSGKTTNFISVIAKLADEKYRFVIVLSGIHNGLRKQTQIRLDSQLTELNQKDWHTLTTVERDFVIPAASAVATLTSDKVTLAVIKKNATVLERLVKWLSADGARRTLQDLKVLIIDDEADQASVATGRINPLIRQLIDMLPRSTYIGYTATPFANVFIDPAAKDLYPKDFILNLPRPDGYFGTEMIFGRDIAEGDDEDSAPDGHDMVRLVPDDDVKLLRPVGKGAEVGFVPTITPELRNAVTWFWLSTAARRARGNFGHSTMLIHTSVKILVQESYRPLLDQIRTDALKALATNDVDQLSQWKSFWEEETQRVPAPSFGRTQNAFDQLLEFLPEVVEASRVILDNYRSQERLDYSGDPVVAIAVGGNTLSRGLTLEGLVVSFFVRAATAYDTLLQMGRWFGFRNGYEDLPRIWMTENLQRAFRHLATVEREMRNDIDYYQRQNLRPTDVAVRIRTHPSLSITTKMGAARAAQVSYSGRRIQTRYYKRHDEAWLSTNLVAANDLIQDARSSGTRDENGSAVLFRGVSVSAVLTFLRRYAVHPDSPDAEPSQLASYIQKQIADETRPSLLEWSVAIMTGDRAEVSLGDETLAMIVRSRLNDDSNDRADIKTLMSKRDRIIDLPSEQRVPTSVSESALVKLRNDDPVHRTRGLIVLYPIEPLSEPIQQNRKLDERPARAPMDALLPVIGMGIVFPGDVGGGHQVDVTHLAVDLTGVEGFDGYDVEEVDLQDALYMDDEQDA